MQTSSCPPWCEQQRCQEEDRRDRFHEREGATFPAVQRVLHREHDELLPAAEACELSLYAFSSATYDDGVWMGMDLGEEGPGLTLSLESTRRLHRRLGELLAHL